MKLKKEGQRVTNDLVRAYVSTRNDTWRQSVIGLINAIAQGILMCFNVFYILFVLPYLCVKTQETNINININTNKTGEGAAIGLSVGLGDAMIDTIKASKEPRKELAKWISDKLLQLEDISLFGSIFYSYLFAFLFYFLPFLILFIHALLLTKQHFFKN